MIASLVETYKFIGVEPQTYLTDVITRIIEGHLRSDTSVVCCHGLTSQRQPSKPWP